MIVLIHVTIALSSVVYTTYLYMRPLKSRFRVAYAFIAATLGSGTYLVISTHARILDACMSGLFYLAVVSFGIFAAQRKFAKETQDV